MIAFPDHPDFVMLNARLPACFAPAVALRADAEGLADCDILVRAGRVEAVTQGPREWPDMIAIDVDRGIVLPRLVDIHTHLDKGHIWGRQPNPDGTHAGARASVAADREANWSAEDVRSRMEFSLRCAFAHGTSAIRTHIDSLGKQASITWPVVSELREAWKGRVDLQAVALFPVDLALDDPAQFRALISAVARHGGVLGGMTFLGSRPDEKSTAALGHVFDAAAANGLDLDFHVDESDSLDARSLGAIADMTRRKGFRGRVVAGHCCSLALFDDADREDTIARVADSGVSVVSLPMCNMYLQDRSPGRTPRWRGVAPVFELAAAGVPVMVASDNTRDPFYAYGDLDMIEVLREATRILQLDHSGPGWSRMVGPTPADVMGLKHAGRVGIGGPADLIVTRARTFNELNARPQHDRVVMVGGGPIDTRPPDYRELDALLAPASERKRVG